jgi:hypothetical protein
LTALSNLNAGSKKATAGDGNSGGKVVTALTGVELLADGGLMYD